MLVGDRCDLVQHVARARRVRSWRPRRRADVPVGGVEDLHAGRRRAATGPANGSPLGVRRHLLLPGGPRREGEGHDERHRDRGLARPPSCPASAAGREPGWTGASSRTRRARPRRRRGARSPGSRRSRAPRGDAARRLLRADEQHPERPAALGDVDQHVLQRARCPRAARTCSARRARSPTAAGAGRSPPSRAKVSFSSAPTTKRCACSCSDWIATTRDAARATRSIRRLSPARTSWPRRAAPACRRRMNARDGARHHPPAPRRVGLVAVVGLEELLERVDERRQVGDDPLAGLGARPPGRATRRPARRAGRAAPPRPACPATSTAKRLQLRLHALADERELVPRVVRVGEAELQQVLVDELARRPGEDLDALVPSAGVGDEDVAGAPPRRRPEATLRERRGLDAERRPARRAPSSSKQRLRRVEPEQVLALHVEDEHPQVRRRLADDRRRRRSACAGRTARTRSSSRPR